MILCCLCIDKHPPVRLEGIAIPVIVVPIKNWPVPAYLQFRGPICRTHLYEFTLAKFTDYMGSWYDMIADQLRSVAKPAVNPFPNDASFKWEEWIIRPEFDPAPIDQCVLKFWDPRTQLAKGGSCRLF